MVWSWTRTATNPTCRIAALNSTRAANMPCCILIPNTLLHYTTRAANLQGSTLYYPFSPALLAILCSPVGRALQAAFYYPTSTPLNSTAFWQSDSTPGYGPKFSVIRSALPTNPPCTLPHNTTLPCLARQFAHCSALRRALCRTRTTKNLGQIPTCRIRGAADAGAEQGGLRQNKIPVITTVITLNSANATIGQPCTLSGAWESVE